MKKYFGGPEKKDKIKVLVCGELDCRLPNA
jgi:hypothetical protein